MTVTVGARTFTYQVNWRVNDFDVLEVRCSHCSWSDEEAYYPSLDAQGEHALIIAERHLVCIKWT